MIQIWRALTASFRCGEIRSLAGHCETQNRNEYEIKMCDEEGSLIISMRLSLYPSLSLSLPLCPSLFLFVSLSVRLSFCSSLSLSVSLSPFFSLPPPLNLSLYPVIFPPSSFVSPSMFLFCPPPPPPSPCPLPSLLVSPR